MWGQNQSMVRVLARIFTHWSREIYWYWEACGPCRERGRKSKRLECLSFAIVTTYIVASSILKKLVTSACLMYWWTGKVLVTWLKSFLNRLVLSWLLPTDTKTCDINWNYKKTSFLHDLSCKKTYLDPPLELGTACRITLVLRLLFFWKSEAGLI